MDQGIPTGDVAAQIQLFDDKIAIQKELILSERQNIEAARKTLSQMDAQLTARLDRGDSEASVERAVQIRAQQRRERNSLNSEIAAAQKRIEASNAEIQKINIEKAPIASKYRQIEAEVGPIKYIAALIYGDNPDTATLERAVRWVIILLIFVFDPLALMLVIAAISSYQWEFEKKKEKKIEKFVDTGSEGYLPLDDSEKESRISSEKEPELTAANFEMTADGGIVKKEQVNPVKKKLKEKLSLSNLKSKLLKLSQIKRLNLKKLNPLSRSNKLYLNLSQLNLKEKLSWQNLTNWNRSPTYNLFLKLMSKIKK
jgi:hypothetical protein